MMNAHESVASIVQKKAYLLQIHNAVYNDHEFITLINSYKSTYSELHKNKYKINIMYLNNKTDTKLIEQLNYIDIIINEYDKLFFECTSRITKIQDDNEDLGDIGSVNIEKYKISKFLDCKDHIFIEIINSNIKKYIKLNRRLIAVKNEHNDCLLSDYYTSSDIKPNYSFINFVFTTRINDINLIINAYTNLFKSNLKKVNEYYDHHIKMLLRSKSSELYKLVTNKNNYNTIALKGYDTYVKSTSN